MTTHDCVCIVGDLNEKVDVNVQDHTRKWTVDPASKNSDKITQLMRLNQLATVNTMFQPKRNKFVCTFLQTETSDNENVNDFGKYIGQKVKTKYKGVWVSGVVEQADTNPQGRMHRAARFDDGHVIQ